MVTTKAARRGVPIPTLPPESPVRRLSFPLVVGGAALFLGIYTEIPLTVGESGSIPMVSALPGLLLLLIWPGTWSLRLPVFIIFPSVAFSAIELCSIEKPDDLNNCLNALSQFILAIMLGYVASNVLMKLGRQRVSKVVSFALPIFCILIVLEVTTPFKQLVTEYLNVYPREYDLLSMADRDRGMGGYRPKLFTSETSYVGMSSVILIMAYAWLGEGRLKYVMALAYTLLLSALVRSPTILLALPILFVSIVTDRTAGRMRLFYAAALVFFATFGGIGLVTVGSEIIEARLQKVQSGADYSTTYRTYGAVAVGWEVARQYPLFGVGPGGINKAKDIIIATQMKNGVPEEAISKEWRVSIGNALGALLIYFGFFGAILVVSVSIVFVLTNVPPSRIPITAGLFFLCASYGAIYTPKFATTFIIIVALAKLRAGTRPHGQPRRRQAFVPEAYGRTLVPITEGSQADAR